MSRYTISDHSKSETQHNQIYGGTLAFSSAPILFTIYASGVKIWVLHLHSLVRSWKVEGRKVELGKVNLVRKRLFFLKIGSVSCGMTVIVIFKLENDCKMLSTFDGLAALG